MPDMTYDVFGGTLNIAQSINSAEALIDGLPSTVI